ncbi:sugar phosphate nucleotidyltransferase [Pelagicoccus sp. SDUM812003]|uniref:sugar phosphate nucleotidyltransferase n=1 Tax=Pelagicoccus sp. SDUM812003 TaxID=3041267 RepID=UPI00280C4F59|nr:sugar phosphate nucleotidyltransferase [Pelagicoccus sp. SDUM812003]MDQ8204978.1 sugar phosphate nucleotidyltransferase [Pelagicoccus sp. SDUM812003]
MKIRKALITLADPNQSTLPLQTLIDRKGDRKPALELILDEAASAGIEEIILIVCPADIEPYKKAAGKHRESLRFLEQESPAGYANAILLAKDAIGDEPFLHLVGDHLCVSNRSISCAQQLVKVAEQSQSSVSGVQATRENLITSFGAVGGRLEGRESGLYRVDTVLEKPTPTEAELSLLVPGLRAGFYLCFFGIHVLSPTIFEILESTTRSNERGARSLSLALQKLAEKEKVLALEIHGDRFDIGSEYGIFFAQLALALSGEDRDKVMSGLLELVAQKVKS